MGKVSEHLRGLIEKQVKDHGIVVWYDPEGVYRNFCETLAIPEADIFRWKDSFFRLRHELEGFLEFVEEEGQPDPLSHVPPKVLVYIPNARADTGQALVELETAGVVMEPGANPWQLNTRLRVIADHVFRKIAPDQVENICKQVEAGVLNLEELDKLSEELEGIRSGVVKLIFGTASPVDVAILFGASPAYDKALESKQAMPELAAFLEKGFGFSPSGSSNPEQMRRELRRFLLMGEVLSVQDDEAAGGRYCALFPPEKTHPAERIRETCSSWRNRTDLKAAYVDAARSVEVDMGIADVDWPIETLSLLETFPAFEAKLIDHAQGLLLRGEAQAVQELSRSRKGRFWTLEEPGFQLRWFLLEQGASLLLQGKNIRNELKHWKNGAEKMLSRYVEGEKAWCMLDRTYRHLERHYAYLDLEMGADHAPLERLMARLRQDYMETVEHGAQRFVAGLEKAGFHIPGTLGQDRVFREKVAPAVSRGMKTAYVLVDALRFEMGLELVDGLQNEFRVTVAAGLAQLPTITPVGMVALMPGADQGMELLETAGGKTGVALGASILKDRASRIKYLQGNLDIHVLPLKLKELVKPSRKRQQEIKEAGFILVTSQEIDQFGEEIEDESEARVIMDEVLDKLRKAIRNLGALGVQHIVVAADHGHLFGEAIEGGMLMDPPGGKTAELHRRAWIGQGGPPGMVFSGFPQASCTSEVPSIWPSPGDWPVSRRRGGAYCHGGASLQELVIPVISMEPCKLPPYSLKTAAVKLVMEKAKITTRFFSVTATYHRVHGIGSAEEIRVRAAVRCNRKEVGAVAMAAYGFEEGTREIRLRDGEANALTLMLTEDQGLEHVSVHVLDAISQLELARLERIPVDIAF